MAEYLIQKETLTAIADAVREKTGNSDSMSPSQMADEIRSISSGGGDTEEWIGDGNTHLWLSLPEGITSPMLGVGINGTVTVDWGDGSEPDVLTGTNSSVVKRTPNHEYTMAGDYVITLTVEGELAFRGIDDDRGMEAYILSYSSELGDGRNIVYLNTLQRVEVGNGVIGIDGLAFVNCYSLKSIKISDGVTRIGGQVFSGCYNLTNVDIPNSVPYFGGSSVFARCYSLKSANIPDRSTSIFHYCFQSCCNLTSITIPDSVTKIWPGAFEGCFSLTSVNIPNNVTEISQDAFRSCYSLKSVNIPDGITLIDSEVFMGCCSIESFTIPSGVTKINNYAFSGCSGVKFYDFTSHTSVPTLSNTNAFNGIPSDCEIRVPAALADKWRAATNWSTYASKIVGV